MEIPYSVERRPDTLLYNGKLGLWLFLASEVMLFGAMFSSLVLLRTGSKTWPHGADLLNVGLGVINTVILLNSSFAMVLARASIKRGNVAKARLFLGTTLVLGLAFLSIKGYEYSTKFAEGIFPKTNNFFAMYFTLTGLHALHVIGGLVAIAYFAGPGARLWRTQPRRYANRIEIAGEYWHFVDAVWIAVFLSFYII